MGVSVSYGKRKTDALGVLKNPDRLLCSMNAFSRGSKAKSGLKLNDKNLTAKPEGILDISRPTVREFRSGKSISRRS